MFNSKSPTLNLHGETRDTCTFLINDFINDNLKLKIEYIGIIHGRSSDILKNRVHEVLKNNKYVETFRVNMFNPGVTIVKLKIRQE